MRALSSKVSKVAKLATCLPIGFATLAFAACAKDDPVTAGGPPDGQTIPDPTPDAGLISDDAATDAGADACDPLNGCTTTSDCSTVDFCSVPYPVNRQVTLNTVWGTAADDMWVGGSRGTVLHWDGSTFTPVATTGGGAFFSFWGTKDDVWAIEAGYAPLRAAGFQGAPTAFTEQGKTSWTSSGAGRMWGGATHDGETWVVGEYSRSMSMSGSFWRSSPPSSGEPSWTAGNACPSDGSYCTSSARAIWSSDADHVVTVGIGGKAYVLSNRAQGQWTQVDTHTSVDLLAIWGAGPDDLWVVGAGGKIFHVTDGAQKWESAPSPTYRALNAVWGSGPADIWAVGNEATLIHYDGSSWQTATFGLSPDEAPAAFLGIWGSGADDVWITGESLLLHRTPTSRGPR